MWIFPLAAAAVSAAFASQMGRQFLAKRRPHQLSWTIALVMFALASASTALGVLAGWSGGLFRAYYLFGAMINVPFLAAGTIYLLAPRPWAHLFALLVGFAGLLGAVVVLSAHLVPAGLAVGGVPESAAVFAGAHPLARSLSRYYSYSSFSIVVLGALWSAWRLTRQSSEHLRRLAGGNLLIAAGTFVVAAASIAIHFGRGPGVAALFSMGLLAGITTMYLGFLRTRSRAPQAAGARRASTTSPPVSA